MQLAELLPQDRRTIDLTAMVYYLKSFRHVRMYADRVRTQTAADHHEVNLVTESGNLLTLTVPVIGHSLAGSEVFPKAWNR